MIFISYSLDMVNDFDVIYKDLENKDISKEYEISNIRVGKQIIKEFNSIVTSTTLHEKRFCF